MSAGMGRSAAEWLPLEPPAGGVPRRRRGAPYLSAVVRAGMLERIWDRLVERTPAWFSKCRALLVRYDEKARNFLGSIRLACALLW